MKIRYATYMLSAGPIVLQRDQRCREEVMLWIDDEDVFCGVRSYYGGDGTPIEEYHNRVLTYTINAGDAFHLADLQRLLDSDDVQGLIREIVSSHDVRWDGSNQVGYFRSEAGRAANERLQDVLAGATLESDWTQAECDEWLWDSRREIKPEMTDDEIAAWAASAEAQARADHVILTDCAREWALEVREELRAEATAEA